MGLIAVAQPASAHIPQLHGRLIDLVGESDLVVIGTVEDVKAVDGRLNQTQVRVDGQIIGAATDPMLIFRGGPHFAAGRRYVFFLHRDATDLVCIQPVGTVFPSRREDDEAYRAAVVAIRAALRADDGQGVSALRAAMISALRAASAPLRYHAVLELAALAHHGLSDSERSSLTRLTADPAADPAIRTVLMTVLHGATEAGRPTQRQATAREVKRSNGDGPHQ